MHRDRALLGLYLYLQQGNRGKGKRGLTATKYFRGYASGHEAKGRGATEGGATESVGGEGEGVSGGEQRAAPLEEADDLQGGVIRENLIVWSMGDSAEGRGPMEPPQQRSASLLYRG